MVVIKHWGMMKLNIGGIKFIGGKEELRPRPMDEIFTFSAAHPMFPVHAALRTVCPHLAVDGKTTPRRIVNRIERVAHGQRNCPRAGLVVIRKGIAKISIGSPEQRRLGMLPPMNPIRGKRDAEPRVLLAAIIRPVEISHFVPPVWFPIAGIEYN